MSTPLIRSGDRALNDRAIPGPGAALNGGGGSATPGGQNNSLQINNNGVLGGFTESDSSGRPSLLWENVFGAAGLRFGNGWGSYAHLFSNGTSITLNPNDDVAATPTCVVNFSALFLQRYKTLSFFPATVADLTNGNVTAQQSAMILVTDGAAGLAWGDTVVGGGTAAYLVWYNGTDWTVVGK